MNAPEMQLRTMEGEPDRKTYVGGSDAAAIMGLGAYGKTPLSVYLHKVGEEVEELAPEHKRFLERRKRWEGPIMEMLREEFDCEIVSANMRYVDQEHDFLACEIDFEWRDPDTGLIENGEIKTVSPFAFGAGQGWGEAGTDEVPVHYAAQCMHGLGIMRRRVCILAAMIGLDRMIFYRIERDDETIAEMRARCVKFWTENILKRVQPEPVSLADVMSITLKMRGRPIEADDELLELIRSVNGIRESRAAMKGELEDTMFQLGKKILSAWGVADATSDRATDSAQIMRGADKIATWNMQVTRRVESTRLREEMPEIYAKFSKATPSRVLRISKPKK